VVKITVVSAGAMLLAGEVECRPAFAMGANASIPTTASSYLWTHAFLI
jgi:hypothetical protein